MDLDALYLVALQLFDPCHWHYYESPETPVAADDVVVDCGAGEGLFGLLVARRCRAIYLVEPLPDYIVVLKQTFSRFQNVTILPIALSDHSGQGYLAEDGVGSRLSDAKQGLAVKLMTLDSLFYDNDQPISYIKGDLEGHEMQVLAGAQNTIQRYRPKIAMTTYHRREHAQEITDYLKAVDPAYRVKLSGLPHHSVMLHAWVE
jgi:FkbM family methyltransferase